jgi:O-antigen/teichoic acid export membrane protein
MHENLVPVTRTYTLPPLRREAVATFTARVAWVALEFLATLVVARLLGTSGFGAYAMALSIATLLGGTAALGFDRLLVRELAVMRSRSEWSGIRGLLAVSKKWVIGAGFVAGAIVVVAAPWIAGKAGYEATRAIQVAALMVPAIAWSRQRQGALQGLGRVAVAQVPELLLQPLVLFSLLGAAFVFHQLPEQADQILLLQVMAALAAGAAGTWLLQRHLPAEVPHARPSAPDKAWIRGAAPFLLLLLMTLSLGAADTLLLGMLRGADEAGSYRAASQMAAFVAFPLTAINLAAAPRIAMYFAAGDIADLRRIDRRAMFTGLASGAAIAAILWIWGVWLLRLFGPGFDVAFVPLVLLTGAYCVNTLTGSAGYLLIMSRHVLATAAIFSLATLVAVVLHLLLIPRWGSVGAAAGTAIGLCVLTLGLRVGASRVLAANSTAHT